MLVLLKSRLRECRMQFSDVTLIKEWVFTEEKIPHVAWKILFATKKKIPFKSGTKNIACLVM